jgi:hypothetical protein
MDADRVPTANQGKGFLLLLNYSLVCNLLWFSDENAVIMSVKDGPLVSQWSKQFVYSIIIGLTSAHSQTEPCPSMANFSTMLLTSILTGYALHRIFAEFSHEWNAAVSPFKA